MPRRLLFTMIVSLALTPALFAAEKPNILFLLADDWRWDTIGCAGNSVVKTPHLDALAAEGVRFTQCRVTTSICCVSRASLLTGQHMARHGIDRFGKPITPETWAKTYPALLKSAGYYSGFVGKYGVGKPRMEDFDFLRAYEGIHWMLDGKGAKIHVTEKNARDSLEFLKDRPTGKPFCLSVSFFAAHAEDRAPEQYLPQPWSAKFYENTTIPVPTTASETFFRALPSFLSNDKNEGRVRWKKRFDTPEKFQTYMKNYYRLVTETDDAIGRILAELKRQNALENTLIVFTGDNGYFHADRGLADKWYPYEEALRVPLIIRDPRAPKSRIGTTRNEMVLNIDIPPTLVAAAGAPVPVEMQGRELSPLYLAEAAPKWRDEFYYQHPTIGNKDRIPSSESVVRRDLKYNVYPEFQYEQFFDLKADPLEEKNLVGEASQADQLRRMREKLATWRAEVKAPTP